MDNAARARQRVLAIFLPITAALYISAEGLSAQEQTEPGVRAGKASTLSASEGLLKRPCPTEPACQGHRAQGRPLAGAACAGWCPGCRTIGSPSQLRSAS